MIFGEAPYAAVEPHQLDSLAEDFFLHHYSKNREFADAVERRECVVSSRPETYPLIPTSAFKHRDLLSISSRAVEKWCLSSGTLGVESRVGRDQLTLDRLLGSLRAALLLMGEWAEDELDIVHLGPSHEAAGDVWFPYVMSLAELIFPSTPCIRDGNLDHRLAQESIATAMAQGRHVGLIGAPYAILEFCRSLDAPLPENKAITVVSAGGWKRLDGQRLERTVFAGKISKALGMTDLTQIRDAFNQVELNTVIAECRLLKKHIPPWVIAIARNPVDFAPQPAGEQGLLSFVDLSAHSYPAAIIGDDIGIVQSTPCECGLPGNTLEILRRVNRQGERGCALVLEQRSVIA